ncbi:MAG: GreA/GreB family elongation factor [Opitutales bacterium]|nr:GreA/GreB family elongation factor [Opitutales bacterium]
MKPIYISTDDHRILAKTVNELLRSGDKVPSSIQKLRDELKRAVILNPSGISPKTVVLNASVQLRDLKTDELEEWILTMPNDANSDQKRISVLAPVGTAILGFSEGDEIEWEMPNGTRTLKIEKVQHGAFAADDISRLLYG